MLLRLSLSVMTLIKSSPGHIEFVLGDVLAACRSLG